jgi:hypothetical protein
LEVALDAAARVNRHLNGEAQALVAELRRTRRERDAWQRHAQHLGRCLAAERRRKAGEWAGADARLARGHMILPHGRRRSDEKRSCGEAATGSFAGLETH